MPVETNDRTNEEVGYGISTVANVTIAAGGWFSDVIDFGRSHFVFRIRIPDCTNVTAATDMGLLISPAPGLAMCDMYETNDPSTRWLKGAIPTTESLDVLLTHAFLARFVQIEFSVPTSGDVDIEVIAGDPAVGDVPEL